MKAGVLYGAGDIRIEEVPEPEERDDIIILKIHKASICNGSDTAVLRGDRDITRAYPDISLPCVFGHESSGEVVFAGKSVTGFQVGDRVTFWCKMGAFAEYIDICPARLSCKAKLPETISYSEGAVMELLGSTMQRATWIHIGEVVAVIGVGPAGLFLLQEARCAGAITTIAVDKFDFRLELAKKVGADFVVNANDHPVEKIKEYCGGVTAIIDATGADVINHYMEAFRGTLRRYVLYGVYDRGVNIDGHWLTYGGLKLLQNDNGDLPLGELFRRGVQLVEKGMIDVKSLITHHIALEDVLDGIRMCEEQKNSCCKVVVDITDKDF